MFAWQAAEATVAAVGILDGEPESDGGLRLGLKKRGVLMAGNFATDVRLLEYVHGLHKFGIDNANSR